MKTIAIDTEATGLDFRHGCMPYLVTTYDEENENVYWEFSVNPKTRKPRVPKSFQDEFFSHINGKETVFLNAKYDVLGLSTIIPDLKWDWDNTHELSLLSHIVDSKHPRNLTDLCVTYLHTNIDRYEDSVRDAVNSARRKVRSSLPKWRIASEGLPELPSQKGNLWKADMWLLNALIEKDKQSPRYDCYMPLDRTTDAPVRYESWESLVSDYANVDSCSTFLLFKTLMKIVRSRNLEHFYNERRKLLGVIYDMEATGVSYSLDRRNELEEELNETRVVCENKCINIAKTYEYDLELPKSGVNNSLKEFVFDRMKLSGVSFSKKTGEPSLGAQSVKVYLETLNPRTKPFRFMINLSQKRKRDTAIQYMESYDRFALPTEHPNFKVLYPSLKITGTDTLRQASSNPNEQNISKQEGVNLRYCFGPKPGREWWALDYDNLELRIPAYESGEPAMLKLFEHPNDPPYYGSYHLLIFDLLHPDKFRKYGTDVKKVYKSTWYQWTKNGNFADQYGAIDTGDGSGTADRAYHVAGAQAKVANRLTEKARLNNYWIDFANAHGYVETMIDYEVDSRRGYPLTVRTNSWGKVLQTTPLNYHVQGTAGWIIGKAMVRCQEYLNYLNRKKPQYFMVMQVHDELVFDFPYLPNKGNLPKVRKLRRIMESVGKDIKVPLTCGYDYHPLHWGESYA
jgi:DNA polymerase I-like protein with 3'-5' exonuclease and polymerase domains